MELSKVKILTVSPDIIASIGKKAMEGKLPSDAEVIRVSYDAVHSIFSLFIWSNSFPKLPEGAEIPRLPELVVSNDIIKRSYKVI